MKIKIITDSTCNLSEEIIKKYDLEVIPCYVILDGHAIKDDGSIPQLEFYEMIDASKSSLTSLPSPSDVWAAIERNAHYDHLILIHVSSVLSGTLNATNSVVKQFKRNNPGGPEITVYDSKSASMGLGYLVLKAKQFVDQGLTVDEILSRLDKVRDEDIRVFLTVSDLRKLFEGGRIGRATYMIADLLHAYPIMTLVEGKIESIAKEIGFDRAVRKIIRLIQEHYNEDDEVHIGFAQTRPREKTDYFRKMVSEIERPKISQMEDFLVGNIIACHTGTKVFGIILIRDFEHS